MAQIWIREEKVEQELFDDVIKVDGNIQSLYCISEGTEGDYVESNMQFLQDFLIAQQRYPLYITFVAYDNYEDMRITFDKLSVDYTIEFLKELQFYWIDGKTVQYHPPCFKIKVMDMHTLQIVLKETFWLAAQNQFYAISCFDNLTFKTESVMRWGKKQEYSIPHFAVDEDTTFFTIFHDGAGFYIFSSEKKYSSIQSLCSYLPKGTVITQINDTLLDDGECSEGK